MKASNEELVSLNEELQSTNEELETSKEEIQSVNEELSTVNLEMHRKVEELDRANADLRNLFDSTDLATIFLDHRGLVRSFTPAVGNLFSLIPTDRGRPLTDIVSHIDLPDLGADMRQVLATQKPVVRQVKHRNERLHYLVRILPYWSSSAKLDGIVMTFVDVTQLVAAEMHHRTLVEELNHRVKNMLTVVAAIANQTLARADSPADFKQTFMGRIQALAKTYSLISRENWSSIELSGLLQESLSPYEYEAERMNRAGPRVLMKPKAALALGLVLHELATNAVKHGALSAAGGNVSINWRVEPEPAPGTLIIEWTERGGPKPSMPHRKGFGTELIERELRYELSGKAELQFDAKGLHAALSLPFDPTYCASE